MDDRCAKGTLWLAGLIVGGWGLLPSFPAQGAEQVRPEVWPKHIVHQGLHTNTAVAADFTGDGRVDVISNSGGATRLFVAPDWRMVVLSQRPGENCIHSAVMDVDGDGDPDFIGGRYRPGWIFWLERPSDPLADPWPLHLVDDRLNGIHGLLVGDVDRDGRPDLLANSAQPVGSFPNSLAWFRVPDRARAAERWERHILADGDAPGLTHYLGLGDVNGDGRPDVCTGAKGGPMAEAGTGNWFAWWEQPADPRRSWTRHVIAENQPGATNILPADVNGDGKTDFVASRGHGRGVVWFEGPDWREHVIHATLLYPHSLTVADLDADGDVDAATCAYGDRTAAWFENDGRGRFTPHILDTRQEAYDIRSVDIDGDGDLDLLVAGRGSKNVVWYANPLRSGTRRADDR